MQTIAPDLSRSVVISFDADGSVEGLHVDQFDLGFLGDKSVVRATEIIFDERSQKWDIVLLAPTGVRQPAHTMHAQQCGFSSYDTARRVEVSWLNRCRLAGVNPLTNGAPISLLAEAVQEVVPKH